MKLLPKVFRTEGDMVEFDPSKILNSIIAETGVSEEKAKEITELVVRRIISSGMQFLSGPHIREIVCSILSENHYEKERKLYTRIGMPLMDYEEILEHGLKKENGQMLNPEKIHHWAANQLAEEYTLLRILNDEESKAHLYGDIYIHQLKYFDLRPYNQIWDPRLILKNGLPPITNSINYYKSGPPKDLQEAIFQLANWFGIIQGEFCGSQVYDFLTIFLSPFAKNLDDNALKSAIRTYIHQINHISMILGKGYLKSSIYCSPVIIEPLRNLPAIGPEGKVMGIYGDYEDECLNIFNAFTEAFSLGDYSGKHNKWPLHAIYFKKEWLDSFREQYINIFKSISSNYYPILVNTSTEVYNLKLGLIKANEYFNHGILQKLSINLPRIAYLAKNENTFNELLYEKLNVCFNILDKKSEIIKKRLKTKHLPFCSSLVNNHPLYNFDLQELCIGFVGLNEAVKIISNSEMHESIDALNLGKNIVLEMKNLCLQQSHKTGYVYSLIEDSSNTATLRFKKLDLKHFPKISNIEGLNQTIYCNSTHFREDSGLTIQELLKKQSEFHILIKKGALERFNVNNRKIQIDSPEKILEILGLVCSETNINDIQFYFQ